MQKRKVGKTDIEVSIVGIGAWQMGGPEGEGSKSVGHGWGGVDDEESIRLVHKAEDLDINLIDTADIYGDGHSEIVVGQALKGRRDKWIVATKGGLVSDPEKRGQYGDASAEHIREACEASLQRLQTDHIDFYQLHVPPSEEECAATMEALADLKKAGKIRYYGISADAPEKIILLQKHGPVDIVQLATNLFQNISPALAYSDSQGIGTFIRTPLAWGATFGKYAKEVPKFDKGDMRESANVDELKQKHSRGLEYSFLWEESDRTPAQAALRAVIDKPGVTAVIPGTRKLDHLLDNIGAASVAPLTVQEKARVWDLNLHHEQQQKND